jgi:4-hydroxy-3-methylbut-2-en-1-yl diphosphate synthase IspG/GcpE
VLSIQVEEVVVCSCGARAPRLVLAGVRWEACPGCGRQAVVMQEPVGGEWCPQEELQWGLRLLCRTQERPGS